MTAKTYRCPSCGQEVTTKDINVEKDIMGGAVLLTESALTRWRSF